MGATKRDFTQLRDYLQQKYSFAEEEMIEELVMEEESMIEEEFTEEFPLTDRMLLTVTFSYSTLESSPIPINVLTAEGSTVSHLEREEE